MAFGNLALGAGPARPETAVLQGNGLLAALLLAGERVPLAVDLWFPSPGWERFAALSQRRGRNSRHTATDDGRQSWAGELSVYGGQLDVVAGIEPLDGAVRLLFTVTSRRDIDLEGVFLAIKLPTAFFADGHCQLTTMAGQLEVGLPGEAPAAAYLGQALAHRLSVAPAGGRLTIEMELPGAMDVLVQDNRRWGDRDYCVFFPLRRGGLAAGERLSAALRLRLTGQPASTPATIALGPPRSAPPFAGFGGNYCFQFDNPATAYTLATLRPTWLRTELDLALWEPENDDDSPATTNWPSLEAADAPGSALRRRFELYQQLQATGQPLWASVWTAPEWLCDEPGRGFYANRRLIDESRWPELVECIGTYLEYAKRQYGFEPALFSFNEPDLGIRLLLEAEQSARLAILLDEDFRRRGLATRQVVGDVASPGMIDYAIAMAAAAPRQIFGAVSFHTWGGASPDTYKGWRTLADRLGLPLLAGEVGVDGEAYLTPWVFSTHDYALREAEMYVDLLEHAQVEATLHWEYTPDYQLVTMVDGACQPAPTRFGQMWQLATLTPVPSQRLELRLEPANSIRALALRSPHDQRRLAIHLLNLDAAHSVTIEGLPAGLRQLLPVTTTADAARQLGQPLRVRRGALSLTLPARSLTTLVDRLP